MTDSVIRDRSDSENISTTMLLSDILVLLYSVKDAVSLAQANVLREEACKLFLQLHDRLRTQEVLPMQWLVSDFVDSGVQAVRPDVGDS